MSASKHVFASHGLSCEASLYLPVAQQPPVVILGHGFAAERGFGTGSAIDAFVDAGYAVFAFDYRNFGGSQGMPRQLVDPRRHCQDWYKAIQYVRSLRQLDADRICLWGSSLGGGHVLHTAANYHRLRGVIAQVPFCNSRTLRRSTTISRTISGLGHAIWDVARSIFGGVHTVKVVGKAADGFAVLNFPGWEEDYLRLSNSSLTWENAIPARSILRISNYNPIDLAGEIECPVLVLSGKRDQGVPREDILQLVAAVTQCKHIEYDMDHFDLYEGWTLNHDAIQEQLTFLRQIFSAGTKIDREQDQRNGAN